MYTFLVVGFDQVAYHTDTIMVGRLDTVNHTINVVSIPRDTLMNISGGTKKINELFLRGMNNTDGDQDAKLQGGIDRMLEGITDILGFTPDVYAAVDLEAFVQLVDAIGGVDYDVPVDMNYYDPTQDLYISIPAGEQHLDGEEALKVVRFRSGYATADLGRIEVQRSLVSAAIRQWVSPKGAIHLPQAVKLVADHTNTDLSTRNLLWLAESFLLCSRSDIRSATLPGYAANFSSGSYYVLDAAGVADIVNQYLNPYEKGAEAADLFIRNG